MGKVNHKKKEWWFAKQDGKCAYCGCQMVLLPPEAVRKVWPENMATLEHKYCRTHPLRNVKTDERRRFLACLKCNQEKSFQEQNALPIQVQRERSSRKKLQPINWGL